MRRAARVDDNHASLRKFARACGLFWQDMYQIGKGAPDAFVCGDGRWVAVEIKDPAKPPSKRKLTPDEKRWHEDAAWHGAPVAIVETEDDLINLFDM